MKKIISVSLAVILIFIAGGAIGYFFRDTIPRLFETYANAEKTDMIRVISPLRNATVTSPLSVRGEARGGWYFEASFPVKIFDANGELLGAVPAQAGGDWMTSAFVPFSAEISFSPPTTNTGTIVFSKDNPSGLPENDDSVSIPVSFDVSKNPKRKVLLYYYDGAKDTDEQGVVQCSEQGMVPVTRVMGATMAPIQTTLELLLQGGLTDDERDKGLVTEFPLEGVSISDISFIGGKLVLTFDDPKSKTSGGACRVNILRMQIEKTVKQFETVKDVILKPDEAFQP